MWTLYLLPRGCFTGMDVRNHVKSMNSAVEYIEKYYHYTLLGTMSRPYGILIVMAEDGEKMGMYHYFLLMRDIEQSKKSK